MTARSPGAFMLSATFHAAIIGMLFLFALVAGEGDKTPPRVLELVAGEGDNFGATVAPKLGTPGGLKVDVPAIPTPKVIEEPVPVLPEPTPTPVPEPARPVPKAAPTPPPPSKTAPTKTDQTVPSFAKQIRRKAWAAEAKGKKEAAKERAEEEKRLRKEELDRQQRAKVAAATRGTGSPKISHIDAEGIAKGVVGGSAENKIGGAGGKALVATNGALTERYFALLKQRVLAALEKPPGISDNLSTTVVFHISASGHISGVRVTSSSGSEEWDRAVVAAFSRVEMPDHPEKKGEDCELTLQTKDVDG